MLLSSGLEDYHLAQSLLKGSFKITSLYKVYNELRI